MNFFSFRVFRMPSNSQDINVDLNSNENNGSNLDSKNNENTYVDTSRVNEAPLQSLNSDQRLAYALRDFLSAPAVEAEPTSPLELTLPFIDEPVVEPEDVTQSDDEPARRDTDEVLNNAACRLRRWRAASRKLRRPRIINNLTNTDDKDCNVSKARNSGHTDLADRLRSLAAAGSMSASAGELLSLAPPPPAATAPPSPGCLLSPSLADQSSAEYFGSSPECCADNAGADSSSAGNPMPPPGPRYKLATEGALRVCCFQHTRTVVDKILAAKFLRRWETHVLCLQEYHIVSKTILAALAFYANGCYQKNVGAYYLLGLSQTTVSDCLRDVTEALNNPGILTSCIKFPHTRLEREAIERRFMQKFGFPGVVGCVDGTHVAIIRPVTDEEAYYNRKQYHSLNVMIPSGLLENPLTYSCMQEVYCISRWDPARKYCLRIVMPHGSLLLQANDAYTRDQWYHSIVWKRNIIRYRNFMTKTVRKEVVLKELKNMVDFVMTTPLQDESVTRAPMQILTDLLSENKDSPDWEVWAENATSVAAPLLAERCATGELCALLARMCRRRPRAAPLPALAPPVRRVLTRNVDFARAPNGRRLVRDYISALSAHNSGDALVRRFVEVTHGNRAKCPHPRAAPNLAAVALAALDDHYRDSESPHVCSDNEEEVLCFADILDHMCEYEDWLVTVGAVMQPVPLCVGALSCPRVAKRLSRVLVALSRDPRCAAHACVAAARTARLYPPSWLRAAAPSDPMLALPHKQLCELWGTMLDSLLKCCCKRKSFLQSVSKQLPDFVLVALTENPAAVQALCLMLEWEITGGEQTQLEIISALESTELGQKCYRDLCERQKTLERLQAEGGPKRLALPVRATDADVAALLAEAGALGNLECLSLAFTSVTSECAHHLIKLPSLRYLNLWATKFGDSGVQLIAEHLPRLQVLNLCETPVSDKGIEALSGLSNLRRLNLNSTKLSAEAFKLLRQRLPHLQEYDIRYTEAW